MAGKGSFGDLSSDACNLTNAPDALKLTTFFPFDTIIDATNHEDEVVLQAQEISYTLPHHNGDISEDRLPAEELLAPITETTIVAESFPDGGTRSWFVVLGSFLLLMASYGMLNSVGVFQSYLKTNQLSAYSSTDVGWIPSMFVFITLSLGVLVGPIFDSHGPKILVWVGSAVFMLGLFLFAECKEYWQFLLCLGILGGTGSALVSTVAMACVPHWFHVRAGMALGTALAGAALGGVVFPLILRAGFSSIGFKWTMRVLALMIGLLCFLGSFMVRARLPARKTSKVVIDLRCFKDLKFTFMTISTFCLELQYFSLLGMFPTFITMQGFSTNMSVYLIVIINSFGVLGRLIAGRISDRHGRLNTLMISVALTIFCLFVILYPFTKSVPALYIFSCAYGLSCGSFISLAPVCIRQISDAKEIGLRFGTCYAVVSFALLISIPVTGELMAKAGPRSLIIWSGVLLVWTLGLLALTRWTCLGHKWNWTVKV